MRFFHIPTPIVFEVTGQDATRYMNARLTQDVKGMKIGKGGYGAALTPQGKTQAVFSIYRLDEQRFFITCDNGDKEKVLAAFKKYIVADRVNVTDHSQAAQMYHILPDSQRALLEGYFELSGIPDESFTVQATPKGIVCTKNRGIGVGLDIILLEGQVSEFSSFLHTQAAHPLTKGDITFARVVNRIPSFPEEMNEESLFSEARFLSAVSFNKGCYVGQEVVEKVEAVGKTARVLQLVECDGCQPLAEDLPVIHSLNGSERQIGKVLTSAWNPQSNKTLCFAVLKNDPSFRDAEVKVGSIDGIIRWRD